MHNRYTIDSTLRSRNLSSANVPLGDNIDLSYSASFCYLWVFDWYATCLTFEYARAFLIFWGDIINTGAMPEVHSLLKMCAVLKYYSLNTKSGWLYWEINLPRVAEILTPPRLFYYNIFKFNCIIINWFNSYLVYYLCYLTLLLVSLILSNLVCISKINYDERWLSGSHNILFNDNSS